MPDPSSGAASTAIVPWLSPCPFAGANGGVSGRREAEQRGGSGPLYNLPYGECQVAVASMLFPDMQAVVVGRRAYFSLLLAARVLP